MPRKTLYIKEEDATYWAEAEAILLPGESLSSVLASVLRRLVEERIAKRRGMERIEVDIADESDFEKLARRAGSLGNKTLSKPVPRPIKQAFIGQWLLQDIAEQPSEKRRVANTLWSVALTAKGKIAVYKKKIPEGGQPIEVYSSLQDALEQGNVPRAILVAANEKLGNPLVEELDI